MKRFLADSLLILILVGIGSAAMKQNGNEEVTMQYRIEAFEQRIADQQVAEAQIEGAGLNKLSMNKASQLAEGCSEVIVKVVDSAVSMVASLFVSMIE